MLFERQQYQQDCVENILHCLRDVDFLESDFSSLPEKLKNLPHTILAGGQGKFSETPKLDVLMETGTGKTFTYLQTIHEIHKQLGHKKFIIVLPRIAIKQGVIQNIKLTDEYLHNLYKQHLKYINYPNDGLSRIQQDFIKSNDLCILVTTNSAFNREKSNINKKSESLLGLGSTWEGIAEQKPIVIIDEPHLLKGRETVRGLGQLGGCLQIRFGATYPKEEGAELSNLAYALDSISAFNRHLVKQIGVTTDFTVAEEGALRIVDIREKQATVSYSVSKAPERAILREGDDIGAKTGLDEYRNVSVTKIRKQKILLSNHQKLESDTGNYALNESETRSMIERSIELHFEKEERLFAKGIKSLSLFFIPDIGSFRGNSPRIKNWFEESYREIRKRYHRKTENPAYKEYLAKDFDREGNLAVHQGYFSGDKGSKEDKERDGINLILNDKEKLLSFDTPLRFIFSVWALQEGWDNPNVFTICKLASTGSETSRRQQVGRGLRIAVDQQGKRLTLARIQEDEEAFYKINQLDMVVSQQEADFIYGIQAEIQDASFSIVNDILSVSILKKRGLKEPEAIRLLIQLEEHGIIEHKEKYDEYLIKSSVLSFLKNNRDKFPFLSDERYEYVKSLFAENSRRSVIDKNRNPRMVRILDAPWKKFKALWESINKKADLVYRDIREEDLINGISGKFNKIPIPPVKQGYRKEIYNPQNGRIELIKDERNNRNLSPFFSRHDLSDYIRKIAEAEGFPLSFTVRLFGKLDIQKFRNNPEKARQSLLYILKKEIHGGVLRGVSYRFNTTSIHPNALQDGKGKSREKIYPHELGRFTADDQSPEIYLYDKIVYDSEIELKSILHNPREINSHKVSVFAKLPKISIPTPYESYNPDFAYLVEMQGGKQLFLVVETKGYKMEGEIPEQEQGKINYGRRFFECLQRELPKLNIVYKTRINQQDLADVVIDAIQNHSSKPTKRKPTK